MIPCIQLHIFQCFRGGGRGVGGAREEEEEEEGKAKKKTDSMDIY
jgi:hypothetical protein